jgi:hypothetical protein
MFRVIDRENHMCQAWERLFDNEDGAGGNRCNLPGEASHQESPNVAQSARSDKDEIGFHPPRLPHDCLGKGAMG